MKMFCIISFLFLGCSAAFCSGCRNDSTSNPEETDNNSDSDSVSDTDSDSESCLNNAPSESFSDSDSPYDIAVDEVAVTFSVPWGYDKSDNATRTYPLVVNGYWDEGWAFTDAIRQQYPAFFLEYQKDSEGDGAQLANIVDAAVAQGLRIDTNRIYLTGFSRGGSGSYPLVRGFLNAGKLFAAVNRVAGQSQTELPDEAVAHTSIWYHVGTEDKSQRVQVAADAYAFLKEHSANANAAESQVNDEMGGFSRTTWTITKDDIEVVKYSVYDGMGHDPAAPYKDADVFKWLFGQSLSCR